MNGSKNGRCSDSLVIAAESDNEWSVAYVKGVTAYCYRHQAAPIGEAGAASIAQGEVMHAS